MGDIDILKSRSMGLTHGLNPVPVNVFRVFIAAPRGMEAEREAINIALSSLFINKAINHGIQFFPVHWYQLSPSGIGNPQSRINKIIAQCDFMIILFKDRWGTPPDMDQMYSSGTEQEYRLALECINDPERPMQDLAMLFGPIDEQSGSRAQIQKIQSFKRKIQNDIQTDDYSGIDNLKVKIDTIVTNWLYSAGVRRYHTSPMSQGQSGVSSSEDASIRHSIDEAVERFDSGETEPAITELAELSATGSWEARYKLGRSLKEQGKTDEALEVLQELLDDLSSHQVEEADNIYLVKSELGSIYCMKREGSLVIAEQLHKDCLRYFRKNKQLRRIAVELRNLAAVYRSRPDTYDRAIQFTRDSIDLYGVLPAQVDLGVAYLELGQIYIDCGFINEAELALKSAERHFDSLNIKDQKHRLAAAKSALETLRANFSRICEVLDSH